MKRDRQIVQIADERARRVHMDLIPPAPGNAGDASHIQRAVFLQGRPGSRNLLLENLLHFGDRWVDLPFQVIEQVADGQVRFAEEHKVQRWEGTQRLARDRSNMRAKGEGLRPSREPGRRHTCRSLRWAPSPG